MRTFVSIEIPDDIKNSIEKSIGELKLILPHIKWVDKKNLHITLKFLGMVEDSKIGGLADSVAEVVKGFGTIKAGFAGFGMFPDQKHPRVIWVGITEGGDKLKELADKIEDKLSTEGYGEEEREFSPHLTIGRIKEKIDDEALAGFIKKNEKASFGGFAAKSISMMKSTLMRSGPVYEEVKQITL
jgi:2'-5' RNA ligase